MRILLVEDEQHLHKLIKMNLELEGFEVDRAVNGQAAIDKIRAAHYDLIILDLMLPKINGMEVLSNLRLTNDTLPVIIISAKDTSSARITGLKEGADDYLTKPFEIEELVLRINKLLTRKTTSDPNHLTTYTFGPNTINFSTYQATTQAGTIDLKQKELQIMKYLISKNNEVVSRQDILKQVWGYDVFPSTRTIDNFIAALRKYFEADPKRPSYIISVRGVGYKFVG